MQVKLDESERLVVVVVEYSELDHHFSPKAFQ